MKSSYANDFDGTSCDIESREKKSEMSLGVSKYEKRHMKKTLNYCNEFKPLAAVETPMVLAPVREINERKPNWSAVVMQCRCTISLNVHDYETGTSVSIARTSNVFKSSDENTTIESKRSVSPSFCCGISPCLLKTSDITGQRSAYDTNTAPLALRTKEEGTRAKNGHFFASSIAKTTSSDSLIKRRIALTL